jgi:hypothetical protein
MQTQIFHHAKILIFKKSSKKKTQILQDIITNLKFQHKPKISSFKNPHVKNRPIIIIIIT